MRRSILIIAFWIISAAPFVGSGARASNHSIKSIKEITSTTPAVGPQGTCPVILTEPVVTVAPNQPEVEPRSTVGIINALCDVTLDFVSCGFTPSKIEITCDGNADGVPELVIPLKNITIVNRLLLQATIPALSPQLPGSPFPLACCGGIANITLSRTITDGDDNVFGTFTQTQTCQIDLGIRAPVIVSASPSDGNCSVQQNLIIPGSCFLLADGKPNVTSVFAVEKGNPNNVIQSKAVAILNTNLIDALFDFGAASAGKTFLIFASGPNGTSRNLIALPPGAQPDCPLGNEQGVMVTFTCKSQTGGGPAPGDSPSVAKTEVTSCGLERDSSGVFTLIIRGRLFKEGATVSVGGVTLKKTKLKDFDAASLAFSKITAKKKVCKVMPGPVVITNPGEAPSAAFLCSGSCSN
jgi:hypothetical protein